MSTEQTLLSNANILTLDSDSVIETQQSKADFVWHEIQNAYRTKKILTGMLGGIERLPDSHTRVGNDAKSGSGRYT